MKLAQQQEPERASAVKPEEQADVGRSGEFQSNVAPLRNEEEKDVHKRYTHVLSSHLMKI